MTNRSSRLRALPCLFLLLVATALLPQRLSASQAFLDLIIDTGDSIGGISLAGGDRDWRQFGFASPLGGVRGIGSVFQFSERDNRDLINFAVHVALQRGDRIRTVVFPMHVVLEALATRQLLAQMGYRFSLEKALEGMQPVSGDGGEPAPQFDAPEESILDEIDEEIVIN